MEIYFYFQAERIMLLPSISTEQPNMQWDIYIYKNSATINSQTIEVKPISYISYVSNRYNTSLLLKYLNTSGNKKVNLFSNTE